MAIGAFEGRSTERFDARVIEESIKPSQVEKGYKVAEQPMMRPHNGWNVYQVLDEQGFLPVGLYFEKGTDTDAIGVNAYVDADLVTKAKDFIDGREKNL